MSAFALTYRLPPTVGSLKRVQRAISIIAFEYLLIRHHNTAQPVCQEKISGNFKKKSPPRGGGAEQEVCNPISNVKNASACG
jgi:hypothetical protein